MPADLIDMAINIANPVAALIGSAIGAGLTVWWTVRATKSSEVRARQGELDQVMSALIPIETLFDKVSKPLPIPENWNDILVPAISAGYQATRDKPLLRIALETNRFLTFSERAELSRIIDEIDGFELGRPDEPHGYDEQAEYLYRMSAHASAIALACRHFQQIAGIKSVEGTAARRKLRRRVLKASHLEGAPHPGIQADTPAITPAARDGID